MAADDELVASVDVPATESRDDDMEAVASEPAQQQPAVAVDDSKQTTAELEEEAGRKGYGRAYAAFGGGKEGLEACAASKFLTCCFLWALCCGNILAMRACLLS